MKGYSNNTRWITSTGFKRYGGIDLRELLVTGLREMHAAGLIQSDELQFFTEFVVLVDAGKVIVELHLDPD